MAQNNNKYPIFIEQNPELKYPNEAEPENKKNNKNKPFNQPYPYSNNRNPNNPKYSLYPEYPPNQEEIPFYNYELQNPYKNLNYPYPNDERPIQKKSKRYNPIKKSPSKKVQIISLKGLLFLKIITLNLQKIFI